MTAPDDGRDQLTVEDLAKSWPRRSASRSRPRRRRPASRDGASPNGREPSRARFRSGPGPVRRTRKPPVGQDHGEGRDAGGEARRANDRA